MIRSLQKWGHALPSLYGEMYGDWTSEQKRRIRVLVARVSELEGEKPGQFQKELIVSRARESCESGMIRGA